MISHIYIRPAPEGALNVVRVNFDPAEFKERATVAAVDITTWLAGVVADPAVKVIYVCDGSAVSRPAGCPVAWHPLPAGHPTEQL